MAPPKGAAPLLNLIRSDQLKHDEVQALLEADPLFARWYRLNAGR
ncbi:hypothetical protein GCM10007908_03840 [Rhizobium albus]|nr:hypothetical protein GCM10007908_03840 [Rhizobium albus]